MLTRTCEGEENAHFGPWPREGSPFARPNRLKLQDKIKHPSAFAQLTRSSITLKARRNARPAAAQRLQQRLRLAQIAVDYSN
jgi:hypothetical protein